MASTAKSSRERVREYRAKMRAKGMRTIQMWVPDTSTEEFRHEAHRQSVIAAQSPTEAEDQAFVDAISEFNDPSSNDWWQPDSDDWLKKD